MLIQPSSIQVAAVIVTADHAGGSACGKRQEQQAHSVEPSEDVDVLVEVGSAVEIEQVGSSCKGRARCLEWNRHPPWPYGP